MRKVKASIVTIVELEIPDGFAGPEIETAFTDLEHIFRSTTDNVQVLSTEVSSISAAWGTAVYRIAF